MLIPTEFGKVILLRIEPCGLGLLYFDVFFFSSISPIILRQCSGEKSIFFNNATNELLFGRKHCFYDLNIKMVHFCTFIMRLLWKLGKIAAILDSRRRKKWSQFWIFCYQIFNISKKLQYLQTYQRDFWNFEKNLFF